MADQGIKKATVLKEDLPSFSIEDDLGYFVRYRIVSNDKNRYSHWSPYHFLTKGPMPKVSYSVTITNGVGGSKDVINMVWEHPKLSPSSQEVSIFKEYDIYIRTNLTFDPDNTSDPLNGFYRVGSSSSTQYSTLVPVAVSPLVVSWIEVAVQVPTYPKIYSSDAAIFTSDRITLVVV